MLMVKMPVTLHCRIFQRQLSATGSACSISYVVYRTKNLCGRGNTKELKRARKVLYKHINMELMETTQTSGENPA